MLASTSKFRARPHRKKKKTIIVRRHREASVAKVKTLPWLQSHVEKCGKKALGEKAADGSKGGFGSMFFAKKVAFSNNFLATCMLMVIIC